MASSSNSSVHKNFKYDVFLSFRGEDTRPNFIDHLYNGLQQKSIRTFKDDEEIKKGKRIIDELFGSIENSRFYIIVFSKNYVSSSWCLDELVKIMECHNTTEHTAYPVFYDVEPSEVRKQSGAVEEAFSKHGKEKEEVSGKWREALKEAADVAGWELKNTTGGHEAKLIQKIVEELSLDLRSINFSIDKKLLGMETRIKDVVSSLGTGIDDVHIIGIKGIGGGGKTTLARAVFDEISYQFEGKSFVANVREVSKVSLSGLTSLQNQVLSDVLNDQGISVSNVYDGNNMMKRVMSCRKVLVVLDDVDHINQVEALVGEPNWFMAGSVIIITTRDEQVLLANRVKLIHNVNLLSDKEAVCLFCRHAFGREIPIQGYEELSGQVVHYAAGLPLTIRVLGSFLCGKDMLEWVDALDRLKSIPLTETLEKLELSYIGLEEDYKQMFLNIACILKGRRKDVVIKVLECCGFHARNGLRVLEQKSLVTIYVDSYYDKCVGMHDHIEEMGMHIVRRSHPNDPNKHSRLWIKEEIKDILANDLGTDATRYMLYKSRKHDLKLVTKGLKKMKELRFLHMSLGLIHASDSMFFRLNCKFKNVSPYFPNSLQYLRWRYYPFSCLPKTFQANNLVALEMANSRIVRLWERGERRVLNQLRSIDLSCSKLRTLDVKLTPNLEKLDLSFSMAIKKLPKDLGRLECLKELDLQYTNISHLPNSICMLKHLKILKLNSCSLLGKLPDDFGRLECIEELDLSDTKIKHLPDSICLLKLLRYLNVNGCSMLEKLPEDLGQLERLWNLNLADCKCLRCIPESICKMKYLERLHIDGTCISHLPQNIVLLKGLRVYGSEELLQSAGFTSAIQTLPLVGGKRCCY